MSPEERERAILEARARALASARREGTTPIDAARQLVFLRDGVRYAIAPRFVREVGAVHAPTPLPCVAPHWLGVTSLHGQLLALADLALLLDSAARPPLRRTAHDDVTADRLLALVLETERCDLALAIDAVLEARPLTDALRPALFGEASEAWIVGATADGIQAIAGDALIADPRLRIASDPTRTP